MPFLSLKYKFLIAEDQCDNDKQPKIKLPDMERSVDNVVVDHDKSDRITIYPNEIKDIATTERPLFWDTSSEIAFEKPLQNDTRMRIYHTGVGSLPNFRINRNIGGDTDTAISVERQSDYVARIKVVSGEAWDLSNVQINDMIKFFQPNDIDESVFPAQYFGREFIIQAKGVDYVDFIDNGIAVEVDNLVLGTSYDSALKILSKGPVRVDDIIEVSGNDINPSNQGKFKIIDVSDNYVEIINALGVEQNLTKGVNSLVVYENVIGFIHLRGDGAFHIRMGAQDEWVLLEKLGSESMMMCSASTHKIQAKNMGQEPITISIQYATVLRRHY